MSAADALVAAAMAQLQAEPLPDALTVFDAPPTRGFYPYAVVETPVLRAIDAVGVTGRAGTLAIGFRDGGERPGRLRGLMALAEDALAGLAPDIGGGWRLAANGLARSRLDRVRDGWLGRSEWTVRLLRTN